MIIITDISKALASEKMKIQYNMQQQLTASLSHEQMTPLNAILNLSEIIISEMKTDIQHKIDSSISPERDIQPHDFMTLKRDIERYNSYIEYNQIVHSSGRMLSLLIGSQLTLTKMQQDSLRMTFGSQDHGPIDSIKFFL